MLAQHALITPAGERERPRQQFNCPPAACTARARPECASPAAGPSPLDGGPPQLQCPAVASLCAANLEPAVHAKRYLSPPAAKESAALVKLTLTEPITPKLSTARCVTPSMCRDCPFTLLAVYFLVSVACGLETPYCTTMTHLTFLQSTPPVATIVAKGVQQVDRLQCFYRESVQKILVHLNQ